MIDFEAIRVDAKSIKTFGLGFIQIKISDDTTMNVYLDDIFKFDDSDRPHSHQRSFHSEIISGELIEYLYDVAIVDDGKSAYCGCGDVDKPINHRYKYRLKEMYSYMTGDNYFRHKDYFHSVSGKHGTITLITKDMMESHDAIVISDKKGNNELNHYSNDELWNMVESVFANRRYFSYE